MPVRVAIAALLLFTVACGGRPMSPAGPSGLTGGAAAVTGATIQGQVQSGTAVMASTAATTNSAAAGLTVSVVGTSISTTVTGTGQFTLNGVPAGSTQLNFSGTGVNVTISISPVQGTETVSITVKIQGNQAEVESEAHDSTGEAELHGLISALGGSSSAFDFTIGTTKVRGDSQTTFFGDGDKPDTFASLRNGAKVEVKGVTRDGFVYAQRIHINGGNSGADDDDNDNEPDDHNNGGDDNKAGEAEASGTISGIASGCPSITFSIGATAVSTNPSTEFKGAACTALKNGDQVKVEGTRASADAPIVAKEVKKQ